MSAHTPGPWFLATSNSWRRFVSQGMTPVCEPIVQNDGHPDLYFRNGGEDGPDACLIEAAPDLLELLRELLSSGASFYPSAIEGDCHCTSYVEFDEWEVRARAAMVKAEGKS